MRIPFRGTQKQRSLTYKHPRTPIPDSNPGLLACEAEPPTNLNTTKVIEVELCDGCGRTLDTGQTVFERLLLFPGWLSEVIVDTWWLDSTIWVTKATVSRVVSYRAWPFTITSFKIVTSRRILCYRVYVPVKLMITWSGNRSLHFNFTQIGEWNLDGWLMHANVRVWFEWPIFYSFQLASTMWELCDFRSTRSRRKTVWILLTSNHQALGGCLLLVGTIVMWFMIEWRRNEKRTGCRLPDKTYLRKP